MSTCTCNYTAIYTKGHTTDNVWVRRRNPDATTGDFLSKVGNTKSSTHTHDDMTHCISKLNNHGDVGLALHSQPESDQNAALFLAAHPRTLAQHLMFEICEICAVRGGSVSRRRCQDQKHTRVHRADVFREKEQVPVGPRMLAPRCW